jgi:predicted RNA-binding Zn ribbon-like protein
MTAPSPSAPAIEPFAPDAPFRYVGGHPAADLVNTVDWLDAGGVARDRLSDYPRLVAWAEGAGIVGAGSAGRLRRAAEHHSADAERALDRARTVRDTLRRLLVGVARDTLADDDGAAAVAAFDALLAEVAPHLRVARPRAGAEAHGAALRWVWADAAERLDSPLWPVVWSAAQLLTSPDAARLRVCAGPDCGWVYVDRSRNGFRRWCEMTTCGTRQKSRRRAERRVAGDA